jgi:hypothetical protein
MASAPSRHLDSRIGRRLVMNGVSNGGISAPSMAASTISASALSAPVRHLRQSSRAPFSTRRPRGCASARRGDRDGAGDARPSPSRSHRPAGRRLPRPFSRAFFGHHGLAAISAWRGSAPSSRRGSRPSSPRRPRRRRRRRGPRSSSPRSRSARPRLRRSFGRALRRGLGDFFLLVVLVLDLDRRRRRDEARRRRLAGGIGAQPFEPEIRRDQRVVTADMTRKP